MRSGPRRIAVFAAASLLLSFLSSIAVTTLGQETARALGCPGTPGTVVLNGGTCTATFSSQTSGGINIEVTQMFEVPAGVSSLNIVADGASGGDGADDSSFAAAGLGGQESGVVSVAPNSPVTPGSTLTLVVGTEGEVAGLDPANPPGAGWPDGGSASVGGGGGGGGSYVYNASGALIMAAGGGGGNGGGGGDGSNECYTGGAILTPPCGGVGGNGGGAGGGSTGQAGNPEQGGSDAAGTGGGGASVSGGGNGGDDSPDCPAGDGSSSDPSGTSATAGGGPAPSPFPLLDIPDGGHGEIPGPALLGLLPSCLQSGGGGGGGGYYGGGGGGGGWEADGGGGGGSGYASTAVSNSQSGTTFLPSQITISFPVPGGPSVSSLSATQGPVVGGEPVTILGSGFTNATAVNFVGAGGTTTVTLPTPSTSDSSITVNAPNLSGQMNAVLANTNYTVDVEVVTPGGTSPANPPNDSYTAMVPVVTAVSTTVNGNTSGPAAGPVVGGEAVTLTGQWFNGADSVSFQPTGNTSFVTAPTVNVSGNGTSATFTAPNATSEYTASGATGDLFTDLIVDIPVQGSNTASVTSSPTSPGANDKFYLVPVAVTDLSDHQAAVVGGTVVEITGTDLTNGTVVLAPTAGTLSTKGCGSDAPVSVTPDAGGTPDTLAFTAPDQTDAMLATGGNVVCDVEVQVPVPELGAGVTVTSQPNPGNPGDTLTYPYPVVNSVSPNNGPLGTNTPITITGSGLIGVSQVQFVLTSQEGGAPGALPVSSNVVPPSALSNTVSVVTPSGGELLISGDPTLTTDVEVEIPVLGGGILTITSAPNPGTPGDTYTFTQANACASLSACNTGTSTGSAPAVASSSSTNGTITLTGTGGAGAVTVGRYSANPVGAPSFTSGGPYFDASVEPGSAFTSATLQDCDLGGGTSLQWWNPAANPGQGGWQAVTPITGPTSTTPPCVTATFSSTSSPTLAQLTGTVFVAEVPVTTSAPVFTADSPPLTATTGVSYSYTFAASGNPAPTFALAAGAPSWLSIGTSSGKVTGTPPTGTTSFSYSVTASNGTLPNGTAGPFTVIVSGGPHSAPKFTADSPPLTSAVGVSYSYQFGATGTPAPTYSLTSLTAHTQTSSTPGTTGWLTISPTTGVVTGTPPPGTTSFTYSVTAKNGVLPNAVAGPFTVNISGNDTIAIKLVGKGLNYSVSGASAAGLITISPTSNAAVSAVTGTITVPDSDGGVATVIIQVSRFGKLYLGTITIVDPTEGIDTITLLFGLTRVSPTSVTSTDDGVLVLDRRLVFYSLTWTLNENSSAAN